MLFKKKSRAIRMPEIFLQAIGNVGVVLWCLGRVQGLAFRGLRLGLHNAKPKP